MSEKIKINDFDLLTKNIKSISKITNEAKLIIGNGLVVYGKNSFSRFESKSNAVEANNEVSLCFKDLSILIKILETVKEIHKDDFTDVEFIYDNPFLKVSSKKIKTKLTTCREDVIEKSVSKAITSKIESSFDFLTNNDLIKKMNSYTFLFQEPDSARIYLSVDEEMEHNAVYAEIGNNANNLANMIKLKVGIATFGTLENNIVLDFERLNALNCVQTDNDISVSLVNNGILYAKYKVNGKNESSYMDFTLLDSIRKS